MKIISIVYIDPIKIMKRQIEEILRGCESRLMQLNAFTRKHLGDGRVRLGFARYRTGLADFTAGIAVLVVSFETASSR